MSTRLALAVISAALIAALAGCAPAGSADSGSSADPASPPAETETATDTVEVVDDACAVLDETAVGAAFGVTVTGAPLTSFTTTDGLPKALCSWKEPDAAMNNYEVSLTVSNFAGNATAIEETGYLHDNQGMLVTDLPDLGDEAFFASQGDAWNANQARLIWRDGTVVYDLGVLNIGGLDHAAAEAALLDLARTAS